MESWILLMQHSPEYVQIYQSQKSTIDLEV